MFVTGGRCSATADSRRRWRQLIRRRNRFRGRRSRLPPRVASLNKTTRTAFPCRSQRPRTPRIPSNGRPADERGAADRRRGDKRASGNGPPPRVRESVFSARHVPPPLPDPYTVTPRVLDGRARGRFPCFTVVGRGAGARVVTSLGFDPDNRPCVRVRHM